MHVCPIQCDIILSWHVTGIEEIITFNIRDNIPLLDGLPCALEWVWPEMLRNVLEGPAGGSTMGQGGGGWGRGRGS